MGGSYAFVQMASANLRQRNDAYNHAFGGFVAGTLPGLISESVVVEGKELSDHTTARSMPSVIGNGLALSTVLGIAAYSGSYMFGSPDLHPDEGRWPTKEETRKRFRRPANETINELGEGRGKKQPFDSKKHFLIEYRYIRAQLPRAKGGENKTEPWRRGPQALLGDTSRARVIRREIMKLVCIAFAQRLSLYVPV